MIAIKGCISKSDLEKRKNGEYDAFVAFVYDEKYLKHSPEEYIPVILVIDDPQIKEG